MGAIWTTITSNSLECTMHELATSYAVHKNKAKQEILPRIIYRKDFVACSPLPTADAKCQVDIAKTPMCRSPRLQDPCREEMRVECANEWRNWENFSRWQGPPHNLWASSRAFLTSCLPSALRKINCYSCLGVDYEHLVPSRRLTQMAVLWKQKSCQGWFYDGH